MHAWGTPSKLSDSEAQVDALETTTETAHEGTMPLQAQLAKHFSGKLCDKCFEPEHLCRLWGCKAEHGTVPAREDASQVRASLTRAADSEAQVDVLETTTETAHEGTMPLQAQLAKHFSGKLCGQCFEPEHLCRLWGCKAEHGTVPAREDASQVRATRAADDTSKSCK